MPTEPLIWCIIAIVIILFKFLNVFIENKKIKLFPSKRMPSEDELFLEKNFRYYQDLNVDEKEEFSRRIIKFLRTIEFEGRKGLVVTRKMQLLITATATKLTFGYDEQYLIEGLQKIIIYPEEYYSRLTKTYNKGETSSAGFIVFSWKGFLQGLQNEHDNINLGFHEFAHALLNSFSYSCEGYFNSFFEIIKQEHIIKELKQAHLLRDYAYTNRMEFMACVIETFFESPEQVFKTSPELYNLFSDLLNQDPLKKIYKSVSSEDYYFDDI